MSWLSFSMFPWRSLPKSLMVMPSTPAAPRFAFTCFQALSKFSTRYTLSIREYHFCLFTFTFLSAVLGCCIPLAIPVYFSVDYGFPSPHVSLTQAIFPLHLTDTQCGFLRHQVSSLVSSFSPHYNSQA